MPRQDHQARRHPSVAGASEEHTLSVIDAFYDAALDEARWPAALKKLLDLTGSQASSFWVLDGSDNPRL